jgi:hypothetical protein
MVATLAPDMRAHSEQKMSLLHRQCIHFKKLSELPPWLGAATTPLIASALNISDAIVSARRGARARHQVWLSRPRLRDRRDGAVQSASRQIVSINHVHSPLSAGIPGRPGERDKTRVSGECGTSARSMSLACSHQIFGIEVKDHLARTNCSHNVRVDIGCRFVGYLKGEQLTCRMPIFSTEFLEIIGYLTIIFWRPSHGCYLSGYGRLRVNAAETMRTCSTAMSFRARTRPTPCLFWHPLHHAPCCE